MKILNNRLSTAILGGLAALSLAACSPSAENTEAAADTGSDTATASADKSIRLVYVEWASCSAATHVVQSVLEQKGYDVQTISVSGAAMYTALAQGDADATVCAWLPTTHGNYFERTKDNLDDLGPNMIGTKIGLAVPSYVDINSIDELAANADKFEGRIIGIDPGAGVMDLTHKVIEDYELPMQLVDGSDATMTAALKDAIDNNEWVAVTAWTPHWKWARWDMKYLEDPKGTYGEDENINTIARKGLKDDQPEAWAVLDAYTRTAADTEEVMNLDQEEGSDPLENARTWIEANPDKVQAWLGGGEAAAPEAAPADDAAAAEDSSAS